ncbi:MAG TPA: hypothetical protein VNQ76_13870, partial [Planctomicrobium sp.]|nr:hypothetical protein [Planctomicrobium sp.]
SLLRLTTVATFLTLGLICLDQCQHGGAWADLLQSAALNGFHREWSDDQVQQYLGLAGGIHLGLAASLLTSRQASVALLAAGWGMLWTLLPLFSAADTGYHDALRSVSIWGAPLVVAMFQALSIKKRRPKYIAENETRNTKR